MKISKNENGIDRFVRVIVAEILFITAYYWLGGLWQIVLYVLSFVSLVTAFTGFCALYKLLGIGTIKQVNKSVSKTNTLVFIALFICILGFGSYYSIFFTKKFFLEDYVGMNQYYKQTLFYTGQNNRQESIINYENLVTKYDVFYKKYTKYHPQVISNDKNFDTDLENVKNIIASLKNDINSGDLTVTHKNLEEIRPIFQDVLKRNGFSMLAVYLVDFHDAMEKIISASDEKNSPKVIEVYTEVSDKLKIVEEVANDQEIQMIRQNLDGLLNLALDGKTELLSSKAAELKSSFVKVYLKRG